MRVLFFATFFKFEGNETNYTDEVKAVVKLYPEVEFLVYTVNQRKNQITKYAKNILWVERKNLKNIKVLWLFLKDMIKIFTEYKPTVIHSPYVIESIIMSIFGKIFRIRSIFHGRGLDINYKPFISFKSYVLAKIACKMNNKIITVSKSLKKDIISLNVSKQKIIPIYDGIDFSEFSPTGKETKADKDKFEIIHASRYSPEKRQDLIIEVCKELRDNNYNFHFTFIGYGALENTLKALIKKYNLEKWITMAGFIEHNNVYKYLERADLYIQPSISEGMPKSVFEAMSMELSVVLTKVGGMVELYNEPGVILIEKNNKQQLYDGIVYFINKPDIVKIGGKKNREFVRKHFNWEIHAKKLYKTYSDLKRK